MEFLKDKDIQNTGFWGCQPLFLHLSNTVPYTAPRWISLELVEYMNFLHRKTNLFRYLFLSLLLILSFPTKGESMSLLPSPQDVVLSSPMEGILTVEGKPASGIKITRKLSWFDKSESVEDFVVTDSKGHFTLPLVKNTLKLSNLTHFVVAQEINALHNGETILMWYMSKDSKNEYGELGGKPVNLKCELTGEEIITREYETPLMTRCSWDSLEPSRAE